MKDRIRINKVLILGANGMLGHFIFNILSKDKKFRVFATARYNNSSNIFFDINDGIESLEEKIVEKGPFNYVINCIGILNNEIVDINPNSVSRAKRVNTLFPNELAVLAKKLDFRIIHISSDGVFGTNSGICDESKFCDADDVYGISKRLGEVNSPHVLNIRTSIIGPSPIKQKGLLEWFLSHPRNSQISGYSNQQWNGVTTLQFSKLCKILILDDYFSTVIDESSIHHFCPNNNINKYELLKLFSYYIRPDIKIAEEVNPNYAISRILATRYKTINAKYGINFTMDEAVENLKVYC